MVVDSEGRMTIEQALAHEWIMQYCPEELREAQKHNMEAVRTNLITV